MPRHVILSDLRELTPSGFEMTCLKWLSPVCHFERSEKSL